MYPKNDPGGDPLAVFRGIAAGLLIAFVSGLIVWLFFALLDFALGFDVWRL